MRSALQVAIVSEGVPQEVQTVLLLLELENRAV